jgi:hypothetical protein
VWSIIFAAAPPQVASTWGAPAWVSYASLGLLAALVLAALASALSLKKARAADALRWDRQSEDLKRMHRGVEEHMEHAKKQMETWSKHLEVVQRETSETREQLRHLATRPQGGSTSEGAELAQLRDQVRALQARLSEDSRDVIPYRPGPGPLPERIAAIRAEAARHREPKGTAAAAYAYWMEKECCGLLDLCERWQALEGREPGGADYDALIGRLYSPLRPVMLDQVAVEAAPELRGLAIALDGVRRELVEDLERRFGVRPIQPIPGVDPFDPEAHHDVSGSPGTTDEAGMDNVVIDCPRAGVRRNGRTERQARVFRSRFIAADAVGGASKRPEEEADEPARAEFEEIPRKPEATPDAPADRRRADDPGW